MGNSQLPMSKMASETAHEGNLFRGAVKQNDKLMLCSESTS